VLHQRIGRVPICGDGKGRHDRERQKEPADRVARSARGDHAPTTANGVAIRANNRKKLASGDRMIKPAARMSSASAKEDQASQAAARGVIWTSPRLAPLR
jgi:hypothetical protein